MVSLPILLVLLCARLGIVGIERTLRPRPSVEGDTLTEGTYMALGVLGLAGTALVDEFKCKFAFEENGEGVDLSRSSSLCMRAMYLAFQPSTSASSSVIRFLTLFRDAAADSLFRCFLASFRHSASCSFVISTCGS